MIIRYKIKYSFSTTAIRLFVFIFLTNLFIFSYAQTGYKLQIVDTTGKEISYATIQWNKADGMITDSSGRITLQPTNVSDSFYITAIAYQQTSIATKDLEKEKWTVIRLLPLSVNLPEIKVWPSGDPVNMGCLDKGEGFSRISNHTTLLLQQAIVIETDTTQTDFRLKSVSIYISKHSATNLPFRIRIYNADSTGFPGEDVLLGNAVITNYQRGKWNEIVLDQYDLKQPNRLFFISIEWIGSSPESAALWVGQTDHISTVITYQKIGNGFWKKPFMPSLSKNPTNIMLRAKVVYPKKAHS